MKSCFRYLLFLLPVFVFNSCSNEVDVLADYEENAAIYGLLDPSQPIQYIKINKVFTNPNSRAVDIAKIADSLYFDTINPMLVELDNGHVKSVTALSRANVLLKDSGIFANSPNYLYATNKQILPQYTYRLELTLPKSGKRISATTNIVNLPAFTFFNPVSVGQRILSVLPAGNIPVQFSTYTNGKIYDAYLYFNYQEINKADTTVKVNKTIKWKLVRSYRTGSDKVSENVLQRIPGILFYDLLVNNIPVNPDVTRRFLPCSIEFIGGNLEIDNYIEASTPSIGIVQKQTDYTNVSDGIGLFASRNTLLIDQITLAGPTMTTIKTVDPYKKLGFQ
jgi:hypothetical protein